jgi:hypothetical protein
LRRSPRQEASFYDDVDDREKYSDVKIKYKDGNTIGALWILRRARDRRCESSLHVQIGYMKKQQNDYEDTTLRLIVDSVAYYYRCWMPPGCG